MSSDIITKNINLSELPIYFDLTKKLKEIYSTRPDLEIKILYEIYLIIFLRFNFFIDQCHDFLENTDRNNWRPNSSDGLEEVFNALINSYINDINNIFDKSSYHIDNQVKSLIISINRPESHFNKFLQYLFLCDGTEIPPLGPNMYSDSTFTFKTKYNSKQFTNRKFLIGTLDYVLKEFLGIIPYNLSESSLRDTNCSSSAKILIDMIKVTRSVKLEGVMQSFQGISGNYNITVDADNAKINYASLLLLICDELKNPNSTINLVSTMATQYDAALGSGTISHIKRIENSIKSSRLFEDNPTEDIKYILKSDIIKIEDNKKNFFELLNFEYKNIIKLNFNGNRLVQLFLNMLNNLPFNAQENLDLDLNKYILNLAEQVISFPSNNNSNSGGILSILIKQYPKIFSKK